MTSFSGWGIILGSPEDPEFFQEDVATTPITSDAENYPMDEPAEKDPFATLESIGAAAEALRFRAESVLRDETMRQN